MIVSSLVHTNFVLLPIISQLSKKETPSRFQGWTGGLGYHSDRHRYNLVEKKRK